MHSLKSVAIHEVEVLGKDAKSSRESRGSGGSTERESTDSLDQFVSSYSLNFTVTSETQSQCSQSSRRQSVASHPPSASQKTSTYQELNKTLTPVVEPEHACNQYLDLFIEQIDSAKEEKKVSPELSIIARNLRVWRRSQDSTYLFHALIRLHDFLLLSKKGENAYNDAAREIFYHFYKCHNKIALIYYANYQLKIHQTHKVGQMLINAIELPFDQEYSETVELKIQSFVYFHYIKYREKHPAVRAMDDFDYYTMQFKYYSKAVIASDLSFETSAQSFAMIKNLADNHQFEPAVEFVAEVFFQRELPALAYEYFIKLQYSAHRLQKMHQLATKFALDEAQEYLSNFYFGKKDYQMSQHFLELLIHTNVDNAVIMIREQLSKITPDDKSLVAGYSRLLRKTKLKGIDEFDPELRQEAAGLIEQLNQQKTHRRMKSL